jgi:dipeptidyl-peptidase-3
MTKLNVLFAMTSLAVLFACNKPEENTEVTEEKQDNFEYFVEKFDDLEIMRYQVPGFETLNLNQKILIYYLSEAAKAGDEITWDQNYKHNLMIKRSLEQIVQHYKGPREGEWERFMTYVKKVWFSKGIHNHNSKDKILPDFDAGFFENLIRESHDADFPMTEGESIDAFIQRIVPLIFNPEIDAKAVCLDPSKDLLLSSATNFYEGVNQQEVEAFYAKMKDDNDQTPISYGLNSKVVKENGKLVEKVYKIDGMYGPAIEKIVFWLEKALPYAESDLQKQSIEKLISYYKTGDLKAFDEYSVLWVEDVDSRVDFVNGFIETYGDPMGMKATWESVVNFKDIEGTKRTQIISDNAQWFEDHSPVDPAYKKEKVKGVTAKVITTAQIGGDCYPSTPIGINLPNADWIRARHGSKSVTMDNITYAYDKARQGNGFTEEFSYDEEEVKLIREYGHMAGNIHTDLHECLGHGSGKLAEGTSPEALKNYSSALEEARADLFALYYIMDPKMVELGLLPNLDAAKAEYIGYIKNGLMTQLRRIDLGKNIEQAHMRNRQLIAKWCYEKGKDDKVIEKKIKDGKTYFVINDFEKLRALFAELLKEVQRIKSEGDFEAAHALVENYAVKVDQALHQEVIDRVKKLNLASFGGFLNPEFVPVMEGDEIVDIKVHYPDNYEKQMMDYAKKYSYLPNYN